MLRIKVGDNIERALKAYKNKVRNTKLLQEVRENEEFVKPSEKKRIKKRKAIYINKKYRNED